MNAISLSVSAAVVLALTTFACASPSEGDENTNAADQVETDKVETAAAATGFTCGPNACVCQPGAGSTDPSLDCNGMTKVCGRLGGTQTCTGFGSEQWCRCAFAVTMTSAQISEATKSTSMMSLQ